MSFAFGQIRVTNYQEHHRRRACRRRCVNGDPAADVTLSLLCVYPGAEDAALRSDALRNGHAIEVEGLRKRFGEVVALSGIDFTVPRGTVFGLLGPNGAGKTTAVRVLATVLSPDGGRAEVLGHDVVRDAAAVRRRIGLAGRTPPSIPT